MTQAMKVFHTVKEVVNWRKTTVNPKTQTIGFIPTMGCLHEGHLSLIQQSLKENDHTVVSIFVNPSQFAPTEDLDKYPRTLPQDLELLEKTGVDVCFAPSPREMYPQGIPLDVSKQRGPFVTVLGLSEQLEGRTRPNFFRGVATVVTKLLNIVSPDFAYFGQKDVQQCIVLKTMTEELFMNTKLKILPIKRDERGLALSSRNRYLSEQTLDISSNIYRGLKKAADLFEKNTLVVRDDALQSIDSVWAPFVESGTFKVDYVSIASSETLLEVGPTITRDTDIIVSCAVYVTDEKDPNTTVRLIDNIVLERR